MKGIYISDSELLDKFSGVSKKINMQIKAFESFNIIMDAPDLSKNCFWDKIVKRLVFLQTSYNKLLKKYIKSHKLEDISFIYIRKTYLDNNFMRILKSIKENNPNIKILMEIPTFPYDNEFTKLKDCIILNKDIKCRKYLYKYLDRIVTFSDDEKIWNINTIRIQNGIDINGIRPKKIQKSKNTIDLITVGGFAYWHGLDRLIEGLHQYYKNNISGPIVKLHIVGSGEKSKVNRVHLICNNYNLNDYVTFYGVKAGSELDELYDKCDIAIGCLGVHRKNSDNKCSPLKNREYCAKGLPFINSEIDNAFMNKNFPFILNIEPNEEAIDINLIIAFSTYLKVKYTDEEIIEKMREFAINNLLWKSQIKSVVQYIDK